MQARPRAWSALNGATRERRPFPPSKKPQLAGARRRRRRLARARGSGFTRPSQKPGRSARNNILYRSTLVHPFFLIVIAIAEPRALHDHRLECEPP